MARTEKDLPVAAEICATKPDYGPLAWVLLESIEEFYKDPENERAFQEWMAGRNRA